MHAEALSRREREALRHRSEILEAAEAVFSEKGYVSASMEEIAGRAEHALATLYKLFGNKAQLYSETIIAKMESFRDVVGPVLDQDLGPAEKIRAYFECRLDLFWENPQFFRFLQCGPVGGVADANAGFLPEIRRRYEELLERLRAIFADGIATGEFRPLGEDLLTLGLEGLVRAYIHGLILGEDLERDREMEARLFRLFREGAGADPTARDRTPGWVR